MVEIINQSKLYKKFKIEVLFLAKNFIFIRQKNNQIIFIYNSKHKYKLKREELELNNEEEYISNIKETKNLFILEINSNYLLCFETNNFTLLDFDELEEDDKVTKINEYNFFIKLNINTNDKDYYFDKINYELIEFDEEIYDKEYKLIEFKNFIEIKLLNSYYYDNRNFCKITFEKIKKSDKITNIIEYNKILILKINISSILIYDIEEFDLIEFEGVENDKILDIYEFKTVIKIKLEVKGILIYDLDFELIWFSKIDYEIDIITEFHYFKEILVVNINNNNYYIYKNNNFKLVKFENIKQYTDESYISNFKKFKYLIILKFNNNNFFSVFYLQNFYSAKFESLTINNKITDIHEYNNLIKIKIDNFKYILYFNKNHKKFNLNNFDNSSKVTDFKEYKNIIKFQISNNYNIYYSKLNLNNISFENIKNTDKISYFKEFKKVIVIKINNKDIYNFYHPKSFQSHKLLKNTDKFTNISETKNYIKIRVNKGSYRIFNEHFKQIFFNGWLNNDSITYFKEELGFISVKINFCNDFLIFDINFNLLNFKNYGQNIILKESKTEKINKILSYNNLLILKFKKYYFIYNIKKNFEPIKFLKAEKINNVCFFKGFLNLRGDNFSMLYDIDFKRNDDLASIIA